MFLLLFVETLSILNYVNVKVFGQTITALLFVFFLKWQWSVHLCLISLTFPFNLCHVILIHCTEDGREHQRGDESSEDVVRVSAVITQQDGAQDSGSEWTLD